MLPGLLKSPWMTSEPNKLRLLSWHKPGTICESLPVGNLPCPDNGNPIKAAIMEYREKQREIRESQTRSKGKGEGTCASG